MRRVVPMTRFVLVFESLVVGEGVKGTESKVEQKDALKEDSMGSSRCNWVVER